MSSFLNTVYTIKIIVNVRIIRFQENDKCVRVKSIRKNIVLTISHVLILCTQNKYLRKALEKRFLEISKFIIIFKIFDIKIGTILFSRNFDLLLMLRIFQCMSKHLSFRVIPLTLIKN